VVVQLLYNVIVICWN